MEGYSPCPSPSRVGKRRIIQVQDSMSEPPRKSPAGASPSLASPETAAPHSFDFNLSRVPELDEARKENRFPQSRPSSWSCESDMDFKLARPIKRAVRHQSRSPSPSPGSTVGMRGTQLFSAGNSQDELDVDDSHKQNRPSPSHVASGGAVGLSSSAPDACCAPYRILRQKSKDILDEYFAQRRRSSCKDITFQFMKSDSSVDDSGCAMFSEVQRKRLDTMEEEDTPHSLRFGSSAASGLFPGGGGSQLMRSLSMDGYNSQDQRERRDDTQALLFDSTPDLVDDQMYHRFPSIRSKRRGAVCYDSDPLMLLFKDLHVEES